MGWRPIAGVMAAMAILGIAGPGARLAGAAETYPVKPLRFIVGPGPSSGVDIVARAIALKLSEQFGQSVIVDNRPGAGGTMAVSIVAKALPDGYTVLFATGSLVIHPALYRNLPYDIGRDLAPVMLIGIVPQVLIVHLSVAARDLREFIALARTKTGQITYGSGGVGSTNHLAAALFENMAGIRMVHVPYKGAGPAAVDLVSGQIQALFTSAVNALQHSRTGRVRALAVTTAKRSSVLPDIPTIAEAGISGYELMTWYGVLSPTGTPRAVINRINRGIATVLKLPEIQERLVADGVETVASTPEQFGALIKIELARIAKIVRDAGIKVE